MRRAAGFIEAHAGRPVTLDEIAAAAGVTVRAVAWRWGWASPSQFTMAYQRRFGVPPSRTLRT